MAYSILGQGRPDPPQSRIAVPGSLRGSRSGFIKKTPDREPGFSKELDPKPGLLRVGSESCRKYFFYTMDIDIKW